MEVSIARKITYKSMVHGFQPATAMVTLEGTQAAPSPSVNSRPKAEAVRSAMSCEAELAQQI